MRPAATSPSMTEASSAMLLCCRPAMAVSVRATSVSLRTLRKLIRCCALLLRLLVENEKGQ
eukprot:3038571-Rhodomonas_salina.1